MSQEYIDWLKKYLEEAYKTPILENSLELQPVEIREGKAEFRIRTADKQSNIYGFIHGGIYASICDTAMGVSCLSLGKRIVTIDMNVSYIKNVPAGSTLSVIGEVVSNGRTIMRAAGAVYDEQQQLLVRAQASYFVNGDFRENDD